MNHLLDTHTLIWFINGDKEISEKAKRAIENPEGSNFVSIASLWEIAIKVSLGKLELTVPYKSLAQQLDSNGFQVLPITFEDTILISKLPFLHRDPFDRILIAQVKNNKLKVITKDPHFNSYEIDVIW